MPTINDVAKRAGVAPITVSRVVNNSGYVSQETRQRVEAAIEELEYVPNVLARSLRSKRTNTLALVITDITNPFFTSIARGVEDTASAAGYTTIFCNTDESVEEEEKYLNLLLQKQVDGIVLVPANSKHDPVAFIHEQGASVVVLDRKVRNMATDVVRCDSEEGAYKLTNLLLNQGHQHIVAVSGPRGVSTAEDRVAGYRRALAEAGMAENEQVYFGSFTQSSGYELTSQALAHNPPPTALFGANNFIAIGAMKAIDDAGLRVPQDIALVSFDDFPASMVVSPFLTVAAQPAYEMGRKATELLLARLSAEAPEAYQEIILPIEIIQRQSSGLTLI